MEERFVRQRNEFHHDEGGSGQLVFVFGVALVWTKDAQVMLHKPDTSRITTCSFLSVARHFG